MGKKSTTSLVEGDAVLTTAPVRDDFGIPVVEPARKRQPANERRVVRNHCRAQGGTVVWFADGTKAGPIHGRTAWLIPD